VPTSAGPAALLPGDVRFVTEDVAGSASEYDRGMLVRLDTTVTPELRAEGLAREVLRAIQQHRKEREFAVTDRVRMRWWSPDAPLVAAIERHAAWLCEEALMAGMDVPPWWAKELADAPVGKPLEGAPVAEGPVRAAVAVEDHRLFFELHRVGA
jgi:isoleucyl-tRNA synthetase